MVVKFTFKRSRLVHTKLLQDRQLYLLAPEEQARYNRQCSHLGEEQCSCCCNKALLVCACFYWTSKNCTPSAKVVPASPGASSVECTLLCNDQVLVLLPLTEPARGTSLCLLEGTFPIFPTPSVWHPYWLKQKKKVCVKYTRWDFRKSLVTLTPLSATGPFHSNALCFDNESFQLLCVWPTIFTKNDGKRRRLSRNGRFWKHSQE